MTNNPLTFDLNALAMPASYEDFMALVGEGISEAKRLNAHWDAILEEMDSPLPA